MKKLIVFLFLCVPALSMAQDQIAQTNVSEVSGTVSSISKDDPKVTGAFWIGTATGFLTSVSSGFFFGILPGFIVGAASGLLGTLLAYLKTNNMDQTIAFLIGGAVGTGVGVATLYGLTLLALAVIL
jgi:hypothetical protein